MPEVLAVGLAGVSVAVGLVIQRITGIGFALVSAPVLILLWGPVAGVQLIHVLAALCSVLLLFSLWRQVDWARTSLLTLTALATTPLGIWLAFSLPEAVLQILVGLVMVAAILTASALAGWPVMRGVRGALLTGAVGGVANATVGQAGPLMGAYALATRWEMTSYVASMQMCWLVVNVVTAALKGLAPIAPWIQWMLVASLTVGFAVSQPIARRVTPEGARRCLIVVALTGSALVLGKGLLSLVSL